MTAEIAILNKRAVALAADSALTRTIGSSRKIYDTIDKIFTLSKHRPVGIMLYGVADFMAVPWESIIKEYRQHIGRLELPTLRAYAGGFLTWLRTSNRLFPEAVQNRLLAADVRGYFEELKGEIEHRRDAESTVNGNITEEKIREIVHQVIVSTWAYCRSCDRFASVAENFEENFVERHGEEVAAIRDSVFEHLPISGADKSALLTAVGDIYCRNVFLDDDAGVLIAGFGSDEIFPSVVLYSIGRMVDDSLQWREEPTATIGLDNDATIIPLAQSEMAKTLLDGIDPDYNTALVQTLTAILETSFGETIECIPASSLSNKNVIAERVRNKIPEIVASLSQKMYDYSYERHVKPILDTVGGLPKNELAAMAESLVNLTSLKRKISVDPETVGTVGGQIDVAVISKGDGFIWVKRKHYFDRRENPHFTADYMER